MRRRKPPGQRKAEEYENENRYRAWHSSKADRRKRPLLKAIEHRSSRRKVKQVFPADPSAVEPEAADAMTTEATPVPLPSYRTYSSTAVPLAEHLRRRRFHRLVATGRQFFRDPYTSAVHREPFGRLLENVLAGGTGETVELARLFRDLLNSDENDPTLNPAYHPGYLLVGIDHSFGQVSFQRSLRKTVSPLSRVAPLWM